MNDIRDMHIALLDDPNPVRIAAFLADLDMLISQSIDARFVRTATIISTYWHNWRMRTAHD